MQHSRKRVQNDLPIKGLRTANDFFDQEWERLKKLPAQERVVRSLVGRERRFPRRPTAEIYRQFRVTWPQQIEADLIKTAMLQLDRIFSRRNMKARIVMMIHDSLWVGAPDSEEGAVRDLMKEAMTRAGNLTVPLDVDFEWPRRGQYRRSVHTCVELKF